jgi:Family of unknown function (DUF6454)
MVVRAGIHENGAPKRRCLQPGRNMITTKAISKVLMIASTVAAVMLATSAQAVDQGAVVSERVKKLTRAVKWTLVASIPINFNTYHPQGMVKIGDVFYVSTVDIRKQTARYPQLQDGYDRDTGEGVGHLIKFDAKGNMLSDLTLGEGSVYHPGGIDFDGKWIWVPTAEYRPNSHAILYKVDPATMKATEVLRYGDHIGGLIYNPESRTLHGVSWGSRRFYRWTFDNDGKVSNGNTKPEDLRVANRSHYIDYQDCKYLARQEALCSGLNMYQQKKDGPRFALGGFEIVDLANDHAIFQVPVELWTDSGLPMTYNPFWIEPTTKGLRAYFMPEDEKSTLYVYEAEVN